MKFVSTEKYNEAINFIPQVFKSQDINSEFKRLAKVFNVEHREDIFLQHTILHYLWLYFCGCLRLHNTKATILLNEYIDIQKDPTFLDLIKYDVDRHLSNEDFKNIIKLTNSLC